LRERVTRRAYLASGVVLMAVKYTTDALLVYAATGGFFAPLDYINPILAMRSKALGHEASPEALLLALGLLALPYLWIGLSMTMRRAVDAGKSPWLSLLFFVPGINYLTMIGLALLPSAGRSSWPLPTPPPSVDARLTSALLGVVAGLAIAGAMTGLSVFVLGSYGASLFAGTPLAMGAAASYLYNRRRPRTLGSTVVVALTSVAMAGAALLLFALEGVFCLAMALPIAAGLSALGAVVGRAIALQTSTPSSHALAILLLLPAISGAEVALSVPAERQVTTSRIIDAPPALVWRHVVSFAELPPPNQWFFQAGIAYPMRARIEGSGVGAVRTCEFSTGPFVEPITTWDEPRLLAFDVTRQPRPMTEWSPYAFVNAPHLEGAFRSQRGEFRLVPLDGGRRTRLEGSTWYVLEMGPAPYWRLWSEWLLHAIHDRVLEHIEALAEHER
jgi:uncharacterized membrane protein YhaH (DUF805 family)/uncharacterized protein YndB with AHSA1/START domain